MLCLYFSSPTHLHSPAVATTFVRCWVKWHFWPSTGLAVAGSLSGATCVALQHHFGIWVFIFVFFLEEPASCGNFHDSRSWVWSSVLFNYFFQSLLEDPRICAFSPMISNRTLWCHVLGPKVLVLILVLHPRAATAALGPRLYTSGLGLDCCRAPCLPSRRQEYLLVASWARDP